MGDDSKTDDFFKKIETRITEKISTFVAFLFFLITLGTFFGFMVASKHGEYQQWLLILPAVAGLFAYYNRAFAIAAFTILALMMFLL